MKNEFDQEKSKKIKFKIEKIDSISLSEIENEENELTKGRHKNIKTLYFEIAKVDSISFFEIEESKKEEKEEKDEKEEKEENIISNYENNEMEKSKYKNVEKKFRVKEISKKNNIIITKKKTHFIADSNSARKKQEKNSIFEVEKKDYLPIENNNFKTGGIVQLTKKEVKDKIKIKIKKELLYEVNSFIACLGPPGSGKSTFGSNYYKYLYKVKNNFFESSNTLLTHTKGIWVISNKERRKIPIMIKKDLLDVEGFQVDDVNSWKYVMIIAFLSTDLIIFNRNGRYDDVRKILNIIENSLRKMIEQKVPRILRNIYIQTDVKTPENTIEQLLDQFVKNRNTFKGIRFEYLYLTNIPKEDLLEKNGDLMKFKKYKDSFNEILNKIKDSNLLKNSVSSLIKYIDSFNETINGNSGFNEQTILKEIELDFNGVYSRYEKKLKNELSKKTDELKKVENINESFEKFIQKQEGLIFCFEIKYEDFTFYGSCEAFNEVYENLMKQKTFTINPKDIFLDVFMTQKKQLEIQNKKKAFELERKRQEIEMKKKREEEQKKIEEEEKKMEEERIKRRKQAQKEKELDEKKRKAEEEKRKKEEEEEKRKREEERKKRLLEQQKKDEEIKKKIEHERILLEEEEKLNNSYNDKIKEINNYFAELKFYETITPEFLYNFNLDVLINYQIDLKNQYEEELKKYYTKKIEEKKKDWNGQIERAKWRVRVQAFGEMKCEGGCNLSDNVACSDKSCEGLLFWVDSDEKYAICDKCPESKCITKISGNLFCKGCGSKSLAEVKWIKGYKP